MARYKVACLPGDGVGKEVFAAAELVIKNLKFDAEFVYGDVGWEFWKNEGNALPQRTIELLRDTNVCLYGAVTSKSREEAEGELTPGLRGKGLTYHPPIMRLRQEFDLHTNMRPCKAYPGNPLNFREGIDIVIFRENTEGMYSGIEFSPVPEDLWAAISAHSARARRYADTPRTAMAVGVRLITEAGARRIMTRAFEYATKHQRKRVTLLEKANMLRETGGLMTRVAREVATQYPSIAFEEMHVDAACMRLVMNPLHFDVIVAESLFGDVVADICAQMTGGLGWAPSGNIGDAYGIFEPVHGSAPQHAGQNKMNPMAMLLSLSMMMDWLGERRLAKRVEDAVESVMRVGAVRTYDMGGSASTMDVAREVARKL